MWGWGRYGMWYDPWGYYPYYDPFMYGGGGGGGGGEYSEPRERKTTGRIRLKANVKEAKVYVDGALYGTVDEFDGLSDHLELDGGRHTLELRADGYETYTQGDRRRFGQDGHTPRELEELEEEVT